MHLRPSTSRLLNIRQTELLVRGATATTSAAEPLRPPSVERALQYHLQHVSGTRPKWYTFGRPRAASRPLGFGSFFFPKKKQKGKGMILYHPSFETRPSHASTIMRRRAWRGQRVNELQQQQHEKRVRMYACTEPVGTGIGAVCVERGGPTCTKTMLNGAQKHTF